MAKMRWDKARKHRQIDRTSLEIAARKVRWTPQINTKLPVDKKNVLPSVTENTCRCWCGTLCETHFFPGGKSSQSYCPKCDPVPKMKPYHQGYKDDTM